MPSNSAYSGVREEVGQIATTPLLSREEEIAVATHLNAKRIQYHRDVLGLALSGAITIANSLRDATDFTLKKYVRPVRSLNISAERIRRVIGPNCKTLNALQAQHAAHLCHSHNDSNDGATRVMSRQRDKMVQLLLELHFRTKIIQGLHCSLTQGMSVAPRPSLEELHRVQNSEKLYIDVQNRLASANHGLVVHLAQKYRNRGLSLTELISEGALGLLRAVEGYDVGMGCKFATYATWWIKQSLQRAIATNGGKSAHWAKGVSCVNVIVQELMHEQGRMPTDDDIRERFAEKKRNPKSKVTGFDPFWIQLLRMPWTGGDMAMGREEPEEQVMLTEIAEDKAVPPSSQQAERQELLDALHMLLQKIKPRDRQIIVLRFGLDGVGPHSLRTIGEKVGLTRERIRQIIDRVLEGLRQTTLAVHIPNGN